MSSILESVNQHTDLVGQNRLELLLFKLNSGQTYGINVFKVKEVLLCPPLTKLPKLKPFVRGVAHIRGMTMSIIDLCAATGGRPIENTDNCYIIISEYNRSVQGFLVSSVDRIINTNWESVMPPPHGTGKYSYFTAITEIEDKLVGILDVEKILNEISPLNTDVSSDVCEVLEFNQQVTPHNIMVVDDSSVARKQITRVLQPLNINIETAIDGKEALIKLKNLAGDCDDLSKQLPLIVSDIEMPEMDGYTLVSKIKEDPQLKNIKVILHTSLSGIFNQSMVEKVGADDFISKFNPDELALIVNKHLNIEAD